MRQVDTTRMLQQTFEFDGQLARDQRLLSARSSRSRRWLHRRSLKGGGGDSTDEEMLPTEWLNPAFGSFDDFGSAMLILYVASTLDGWEEFMWAGMDATAENVAPERNDFSPASIFFLAWLVIGSFVSINLFVGAIVENFTRIKGQTDGSATMTPEQQQWAAALKAAYTDDPDLAPHAPTWWLRKSLFDMIHTLYFEYFIMSVIMLNVLGMALDYHGMENSPELRTSYLRCMAFFSYFYYGECLLKLFGLGCYYFKDNWCRFDFFLVLVSLSDQFFNELMMQVLPMPPTVLRVLRVARVFRIVRLLKNLKGLRDLLFTLVLAFPALVNVGCLLGIVMYVYAVLGLNLFTFVMPGAAIDDNRNFVTFNNAMLVLFQCLTGDGWSEIMDDLMVDEERGCDPHATPSDCGTPLALPYFISYTITCTFVMLNLIVAVILENFTSLGDVNPSLVSAQNIADFKDAWGHFDPAATGKIPVVKLPKLVRVLEPPLGLSGTPHAQSTQKVMRYCMSLGLLQEDGKVAFREVLDALISKNYDDKQVSVADIAAAPAPAAAEETTELQDVIAKRQEALGDARQTANTLLAEELLRMFIRSKREQRDRREELQQAGDKSSLSLDGRLARTASPGTTGGAERSPPKPRQVTAPPRPLNGSSCKVALPSSSSQKNPPSRLSTKAPGRNEKELPSPSALPPPRGSTTRQGSSSRIDA
jgi:hypothetical protein